MMPKQKSSTAQDLARGKPSEIDFLNGRVRRGAELGIPTPTNHALQVMVKLAKRGKAGVPLRSGNLVHRHLVRDAAQRHARRAGFSPLLSSRARACAFSTTCSVTTIEREAARPWTREAMLTVWPK